MRHKLQIEAGDKLDSIHFFVKAKSIIVTTSKGECLIITCEKNLDEQTKILGYFKDQESKKVT